MRPNRSLTILLTASVLALAACSGERSADPSAAATEAAAPAADAASADAAGPGIGGAVAPGVAFTYSYAFTLPAKKIAGMQQQHAAACEKLGPTRCRVTSMSYEQPQAEAVEAKLDFLLAPDLAHRFGSEGIAAVEAAAGKLEHALVNGENAGDAILLSQSDSAAIAAEVERLDARLRAKGLTAGERVELQRRVEELRGQLRDEAKGRQGLEASLATTPVTFAYASEGVFAGNTFGKAAEASWNSASGLLSLLLLIAGVALPWLALAFIVGLLWRSPDLRRLLRRLFGITPPGGCAHSVALPSPAPHSPSSGGAGDLFIAQTTAGAM